MEMARRNESPIGVAHSESMEKRARKSAAYRAALQEQQPYEQFARLVIRKRMKLGLTQQELARPDCRRSAEWARLELVATGAGAEVASPGLECAD